MTTLIKGISMNVYEVRQQELINTHNTYFSNINTPLSAAHAQVAEQTPKIVALDARTAAADSKLQTQKTEMASMQARCQAAQSGLGKEIGALSAKSEAQAQEFDAKQAQLMAKAQTLLDAQKKLDRERKEMIDALNLLAKTPSKASSIIDWQNRTNL